MTSLAEFERFSRQTRLAEVGADGQARIAQARLAVAESSELERAYLERAGVGQIEIRDDSATTEFGHSAAFQNAHAADVAAQAWRALRALRLVLEVGT